LATDYDLGTIPAPALVNGMAKHEVTCANCDKTKKYIDTRDITKEGWYIIGWDVATGGPIVSCDKCPPPFWIKNNETKRI